MKEDQGPNKCTRDNSKKIEVMEDKEIDKMKGSAMNMNILVDQAIDLLKTL